MPTYDYECDACGHAFELYQGINDPKQKKCPNCGKLKLRRLLGTGAAIVFKGSGFYQTDYRSESYKKAAAADKPSDSSSASDSSKSSETKSAEAKSVEPKASDTKSTSVKPLDSAKTESRSKPRKRT